MISIPLSSPRTNELHQFTKRCKRRIRDAFRRFRDMKNKTEMMMTCDANHLLLLCRDIHFATLYNWDPKGVVRKRSQYRDNDVHEMDENIVLQGQRELSWWRYNETSKSFTILHCSLESNEFEGYWFQVLKSGKCFVQSNRSREVLEHLYQTVKLDEMDRIFSNWTCSYCSIVVPSSFLSCKKCLRPRYWICENIQCEWPQTQDAKVCRNCNYMKDYC